jgi:cytochrome c553
MNDARNALLAAMLLAGLGVAGPAATKEHPLDACRECHRVQGPVDGNVPIIEGQHREYLEAQLRRFRDRHRDVFPMSALTAGFREADMARIAALGAAQDWPMPRPPASAAKAIARGGQRVEALECAACHGGDHLGQAVIPRLAAQHAAYLERQIREFAESRRYHPPTGVGSRMYQLDDAEIRAVAAYLQALESPR